MRGKQVGGFTVAADVSAIQKRLKKKHRILVASHSLALRGRWGAAKKASVFYELGSLVKAGVNLADALKILAREDPVDGVLCNRWRQGIQSGKSLSRCVAATPEVGNSMVVKMLEVGEATGEMALCLQQIATHYHDLDRLRRKVVSALIYPGIVVGVSIIAVVVLTFYVIPMFLEMFQRYKVTLPAVTQIMIALSDFLSQYGWIIPLLALLVWGSLKLFSWHRHPLFFKVLSRTPLVGRPLALFGNLSLLRNLANLLKADVRVHDSVALLEGLFRNPETNRKIATASQDVLKGQSLSMAFKERDLLSERDRTLMKIGEETGNLAQQVVYLAEHYERRLDLTLERFLSLFEPVLIIVLSLVIGFILVALYLPLFDMLGGDHVGF